MSEQIQKPYIIGITGGSGSGKTTFLRQLREAFPTTLLCLISQDDYYYPREEQEVDENGVINFDLPKSINKKQFFEDVLALSNGESLERNEYLFNNKEAAPKKIMLHPAPIIIVEGLFVLHFKKIRRLLDLKVYFHAKENLKIIRRIHRDAKERNYPIEDVLYRYQHHVEPSFERYIRPHIEDADLIINNNIGFEQSFAVLKGFIESKVKE